MKSNKLRKNAVKLLLCLLLILTFAAQNSCSTKGRVMVTPENRIPLNPDRPQQGTWRTQYAVLDYEVVKLGDTVGLIIDGRATRWLDQIVIWVLFLDKDGRLLERETVFNSGFRTLRTKERLMKGRIERAYEVPQGAKYMAFQTIMQPYRGRRQGS